jgi:hypothetical protein
VENALERVVVTLVNVTFTRIRVKITLVYVKITLCVHKLHVAFKNYIRACEHHTMRIIKTLCHRKQHLQTQYEKYIDANLFFCFLVGGRSISQ